MPTDFPTINRSLIVNDEPNDSQGQLAPGEEAVDGDGRAVATITRSTLAPTAADIRPEGQLWLRTTNDAMYWSRGGGLWYQFRDAAAVPAHQATHRAGGADALPWATILGSGTLAARPAAAAANAGYYYDSTDTHQLFRSTGAAWVELSVSQNARDYTHVQSVPALAWVVNHNLGRFPAAVTVLDSANTYILAPYQNLSTSQLVVSFGMDTAGSCLVR